MSDSIWAQDLKIVDRNFSKDLTESMNSRNKHDYSIVSGEDNLAQAIKLRLLVPKGSYSHLGHPSYGSRLFELIGEINNEINRQVAELYVRETLAQEKRIKTVREVRVSMNEYNHEFIDIYISVLTIKEAIPLDLTLSFSLEE